MCDTGIWEVCYFSVEPLGMDISYLVISADVRRNAYACAGGQEDQRTSNRHNKKDRSD